MVTTEYLCGLVVSPLYQERINNELCEFASIILEDDSLSDEDRKDLMFWKLNYLKKYK